VDAQERKKERKKEGLRTAILFTNNECSYGSTNLPLHRIESSSATAARVGLVLDQC